MRNSSHAINEWVRSALAGLIGVVVSVTSSDVRAQQWIATTPQLKTACETSPGNVVVLNEATTIVEGARYPFSEQVLTGCTIVLGPNAKLATEGVAMRFAGPLVVQSATPTEVKLTRSFLAAASVNFNLPGAGNAIEMEFSHIHATTGGLLFTMGDESKLTVMARILNGPLEAMTAATTAQIRSGRKFSASLSQMRISAPQGIDISMNGAEGLLTINTAWLTAARGNIGISSPDAKGIVDLSSTNLVFANMLTLRLAGSDSLLKLQQVGMAGFEGRIAPGGMVLEVGAGAAENGSIEASNVGFNYVASMNLRASVNGQKGALKIQKSSLWSAGDMVMETGAQGLTEVVENYGASSTRLRVATGSAGSCIASNTTITAPVMQVCQ
jgi:hypothetical protein